MTNAERIAKLARKDAEARFRGLRPFITSDVLEVLGMGCVAQTIALQELDKYGPAREIIEAAQRN